MKNLFTDSLRSIRPVSLPVRNLVLTGVILLLSCVAKAANKYWVGAPASNWSNTLNWSAVSGGAGGAGLPGSSDIAIFDGGGINSCTIDVAATVSGVSIAAGYTGITSINPSIILTVGSSGFSQAAGTFTGNSGNIIINGPFNLSGGTFTSTTGTLQVSTGYTFSGGIFNHNNGTIYFSATQTITGTTTFYNILFGANAATYTINAATTLVSLNNVSISGANWYTINTGTVDIKGNLSLANTTSNSVNGGSAIFLFDGSGTQAINSTVTTTDFNSALPNVQINKTAGVLNLNGIINFNGTSFTTSAGASLVNPGTSSLTVSGTCNFSGQDLSLYDIYIPCTGQTITLAAGYTLVSTHNVTINGVNWYTINTGTLDIKGDLTLTGSANNTVNGGSATFLFDGTGAQNINSSLSSVIPGTNDRICPLPNVNINKPSGSLNLNGVINMNGSTWTTTAGASLVNAGTSTLMLFPSVTFSGQNLSLYNIYIAANSQNITLSPSTYMLTSTGNVTVNGTGWYQLNTGIMEIKGDLTLVNTSTSFINGGTGTLLFDGTGVQNINSSAASYNNICALPSVQVNKTSGSLNLSGIINFAGASWNTVAGAGLINVGTSALNATKTTSLSGQNLSFYDLMITGNNSVTTMAPGLVWTSNHLLTLAGGTSWYQVNTGTLEAKGDITVSNTNSSINGGGNALLLIDGGATQAFTGSGVAGGGKLPYVQINKTGGALNMSSIISESRDWTYVAGTVNPGTSTVSFGGNNLSVTSTGMNFYDVSFNANTTTLAGSLTANDNLTISGSAVLSPLSNTINVAHNWANWGTGGFTEGTGTVAFNGSIPQTVTTTGGENFNNLTINNTSASVQLLNNATVASTLTMTKGNINLGGNTLTLGLSTANIGMLAWTAGKMIGTGSFKRWFNTSVIPVGSQAGLFPMGTSVDARTISLSAPLTGPSAGGTIAVSYNDAGSNTAVSILDAAVLVQVRKNLNWSITEANGFAGGAYNLSVDGTGYGSIGNVNDLRLTLVSSVTGLAGINAGTTTNPVINRTTLNAATLASTFYLGSVNPIISPLPVDLVSFTAILQKGIVNLSWQTAAEKDNNYFIIERSSGDMNWKPVGRVNGQGTTSLDIRYTFADLAPVDGVSYYRIQQVDHQGTGKISSTRKISMETAAQIQVYPNPATSALTIRSIVAGPLTIQLLSSTGQQLTFRSLEGGKAITFDMSNYPAGAYYIKTDGRYDGVHLQKFIVAR